MKDNLDDLRFYQASLKLWEACWQDTNILMRDFRGKEIARQLIRSVGSVSANIEEGYGRGFGKEYTHFLRISRGSARESKGWYKKSQFLLDESVIQERVASLDYIITMINRTIHTLKSRK